MTRRGHAPNHSGGQAARTVSAGGYARPLVDTTDKVRRTPYVKRRTVPCDQCGAGVGAPCVNQDGKPISTVHRVRARAAVRKHNQENQ